MRIKKFMNAGWIRFLNEVTEYCNQLEKEGCDTVFFRGHSHDKYALMPSLFRKSMSTSVSWLENALFYDFVSMAGSQIDSSDSWDILFKMRHYGMPTRLLDWTTNFANALYFAISPKRKDKPHIWILNAYNVGKSNVGYPTGLLNPYYDIKDDYVKLFVNGDDNPNLIRPEYPIPLYPPRNNPRIFAQQGVFTLHGTAIKTIEELAPECVKKFYIPTDCYSDADKFLNLSGIHEYSVYPDLAGLSSFLKSRLWFLVKTNRSIMKEYRFRTIPSLYATTTSSSTDFVCKYVRANNRIASHKLLTDSR